VVIGGDGSMACAHALAGRGGRAARIIGVPKTIDNDLSGTDYSFGFWSAVQIGVAAIDRLHTTANSHKRIMVIELMGHNAGWLTLYAGIAGGGDVILLPEIKYNIEIVADYLIRRAKAKKPYSIVVVAEGIEKPKKEKAATYIAQQIEKITGLETRETILGYIQRGGSPSPNDRILATRFGAHAVELIAKGKFGQMVALKGQEVSSVPLKDAGSKTRLVPQDFPLIGKGRKMGICFGDKFCGGKIL